MDTASFDRNVITANKIVTVINNIKILKRIIVDEENLSNDIKKGLKEKRNALILEYNILAKEYNKFISSYKNDFDRLSYAKIKCK